MTEGTAKGSARSRKRSSYLPVGNILHENPPQLEDSLPLVLRPHGRCLIIVYGRDHLRDSAEVSAEGMSAKPYETWIDLRPVYRKEQVDRSPSLLERLVETLIAVRSARPNLMLERLVHVVLGE
jgi:hypothetical protein